MPDTRRRTATGLFAFAQSSGRKRTPGARVGPQMVLAACLLLFAIASNAELTHINCGALGDRPCTVGDGGWWEGGLDATGCDRGLKSEWIGYCRERASWWPHPCISFRYPWQCKLTGHPLGSNDGRRDMLDNYANDMRWPLEAYRRQIEIGRNEPINWINLIGTHNAFNNKSDGYLLPNQTHSMTEQMEFGSRVLFLDVHQEATCNCLKLSHAQASGTGDAFFDRHLIYGLREIREWLRDNPSQFVILRFETYFEEGQADDPQLALSAFRDMLAAELGPYLLRANEKPVGRWPTVAEMRAIGRRAIAISDGPDNAYVHNGGYSSGRNVRKILEAGSEWTNPTNERFTHIEEDHLRTLFYDTCHHDEGAGMICPFDESCEKDRKRLYDWCPPSRVIWIRRLVDWGFSTYSFDSWMDEDIVTESAPHDVDKAWAFDDLVWTWKKGDFGWLNDNMAAAMDHESGRWYSASPEEQKHFACSYLREGDPAQWKDTLEGRGPRTMWAITAKQGAWADGWATCAEEFGASGFVFSVPANSWQNHDLYVDNEMAGDVWLAYRDTEEGTGTGHVNWDVDRGFGTPEISAEPVTSREGELVRFEVNWPLAELLRCLPGDQAIEGMLLTDRWDFGDGTPAAASDEFASTSDGVRFVKWHTYRDNSAPYVVRHRLPESCPDDQKSRGQVVYNVIPEVRPDCSAWDSCAESIERDESIVRAGDSIEIKAAYFDAGADDVHSAEVDWGDGSTGPGVVSRSAQSTDAATGTLAATHTYQQCGRYRVLMSVTDDDGGSGSEYRTVRVDDPPPKITCPSDVVAEATSQQGTAVDLGQPVVSGTVCAGAAISSDGPPQYPLGVTEITWSARNINATLDTDTGDETNLEDSCAQKVTVVDTTAPLVKPPPDVKIRAWKTGQDIGRATATDAVHVRSITNDAPKEFRRGRTIVTWYAIDDAGNVGTATQVVTAKKKGGGALGIGDVLLLLVTAAAGLRLRGGRGQSGRGRGI